MLNPIVISAPQAVALVAALALFLFALDRFLRSDVWDPWAGQTRTAPPVKAAARGRHRPENIPNPTDWAAVTAKRLNGQHLERFTLTPVADEHAAIAERLQIVRDRDIPRTMWSWSDNQPVMHEREPAGLPDRQPVEPGPLHVTPDVAQDPEDTRELESVA
jgi:hypothetical protein